MRAGNRQEAQAISEGLVSQLTTLANAASTHCMQADKRKVMQTLVYSAHLSSFHSSLDEVCSAFDYEYSTLTDLSQLACLYSIFKHLA